MREYHVRFCERRRGKFPRPTHHCVFRVKSATDSAGKLPPIPPQTCHLFRAKAAGHSA
jgi:hypothetical protein